MQSSTGSACLIAVGWLTDHGGLQGGMSKLAARDQVETEMAAERVALLQVPSCNFSSHAYAIAVCSFS